MIFRLILLFILTTNLCSGQKYLHIYGKIHPRSSDTVSLYAYKSTFSYLSKKELVQYAVLDKQGNYSMKIPWDDGAEINLLNGQNWIIYNVFLNPGDSLEISRVKDEFFTDGKGSENIIYAFQFEDKFYSDSVLGKEYANSFGTKNNDAFDKYISNRRNAQLKFLDDFRNVNKLGTEAYEVQKANIIYKFAVDKLQYLWKHPNAKKHDENIIVESNYFIFMKNLKVDNAASEKSSMYYHFLNTYVESIWMNYLYKLSKPERLIENPNAYKLKVADSIFMGREKELAIASILVHRINFFSSSKDSSYLKLFAFLEENGKDKKLYNRLLQEYNAVNSLIGKPAPLFTAFTQNGKKFSLESLKGQVVLLDIWSTSCGPCIKNIPESVKLKNELKNQPFETLNLCMNSQENIWKKTVSKHKWNGIHIYSGIDDELYQNYRFNSFQQYILIDKNGNIVNLSAQRPGNPLLKEQILELINKN